MFMAGPKAKTAIVVGAGVLVAAIIIYERRPYPWQVQDYKAAGRILDQVSPQVKIVPTIFSPSADWTQIYNGKMLGMARSLNNLFAQAYDASKYRTVFGIKMPEDRYDFIANLPEDNRAALRREIERQFNLTAKTEKRKTDVLLLTVKNRNVRGLRSSTNNSPVNNNNGAGFYLDTNVPLSNLAGFLENYFEIPVVDRTGLAGRFDISIRWGAGDWEHRNTDALKKVILEELGLELVPSREEIDMLVVENAN